MSLPSAHVQQALSPGGQLTHRGCMWGIGFNSPRSEEMSGWSYQGTRRANSITDPRTSCRESDVKLSLKTRPDLRLFPSGKKSVQNALRVGQWAERSCFAQEAAVQRSRRRHKTPVAFLSLTFCTCRGRPVLWAMMSTSRGWTDGLRTALRRGHSGANTPSKFLRDPLASAERENLRRGHLENSQPLETSLLHAPPQLLGRLYKHRKCLPSLVLIDA